MMTLEGGGHVPWSLCLHHPELPCPMGGPSVFGKKGIGGEKNKGAGRPLCLPSPWVENWTDGSCQSWCRDVIVFLNLPESSGMPRAIVVPMDLGLLFLPPDSWFLKQGSQSYRLCWACFLLWKMGTLILGLHGCHEDYMKLCV